MPRARIRTSSTSGRTLPALIAGLLLAATAGDAASQACERPCVGPKHGAIIAAGGGVLDASIYERFVKLAGGSDAKIVLIPTAGARYGSHDGWTAIEELHKAGAEQLEVLHTRSRSVANLAAFAAPLKEATGVWFSGGRQFRLVDVYLQTETHRELRAVLERGGVIGGNSAGASALASYLVRGSEDTELVMAPDKDIGFGFLRNVAIDQHLLTRGRENNLIHVLQQYPHLLGVGLSEGSAILVTRDFAEVLGNRVAVYDATDPLSLIPLRWLDPGDVYDLGARRMFLEDQGRDRGR
ncbi:MAG: cyanophycinase [Gemmatimonadetes bacterium]|nr:cyanophycinase [Gemmatimonadota bacterium]